MSWMLLGRVFETWQVCREPHGHRRRLSDVAWSLPYARCDRRRNRTSNRDIVSRRRGPESKGSGSCCFARHWLMGCRRREEHARWRRHPSVGHCSCRCRCS